jgi:hypothetical protein
MRVNDGRNTGDATSSGDEYLYQLAQEQLAPGFVIQLEQLAKAVKPHGGGKAISPPDKFEPFQVSLDLYIGVTTPQARTEVPHWHPDQTEAYHVVHGHLTVQY